MAQKVISFINMKGGVGKTTLAVNVSYALSQIHAKRVLLVDVDPQFNATQYLVEQKKYIKYIEDENKTITDIFSDPITATPGLVTKKKRKTKITPVQLENVTIKILHNSGRLDLIPSFLNLMQVQDLQRGVENRLKIFLDKVKDAYDYIIIDCPPTISIYTLSAYLASDSYIVPVKPDNLSTIGYPLLLSAIENYEANTGKALQLIGIVFSMVDSRTKLMNNMMGIFRKRYPQKVFQNVLHHSTRVAELVGKPDRLFRLSIYRKYKDEIVAIAGELLARTQNS